MDKYVRSNQVVGLGTGDLVSQAQGPKTQQQRACLPPPCPPPGGRADAAPLLQVTLAAEYLGEQLARGKLQVRPAAQQQRVY